MQSFNATVSEDITSPIRLDKYIGENIEGFNRSKLKTGVKKILVNGKIAKLSTKVSFQDVIYLEWEENIPDDIEPQNIPLEIIYEDKNVTVVNKKQGMVTHPAAGNWNNTLVNALLYHWGKGSIINKDNRHRPGIVHRLDKDTSGVIITARNSETEEFLANQFKKHKEISKIYICICKGHPPVQEGIIKTNISRDMHDRKKFKAVDLESSGKTAITKFKCIACYGPFSLIKVKIFTGRTHQIRVHLKFLGCPVLGDPIYSKGTKDSNFENASLMLHAFKLRIGLPDSNSSKTFYAKIPVRFKRILKVLHENFNKTLPPEKLNFQLKEIKTSSGKKLPLFTAKKGYGQWQK